MKTIISTIVFCLFFITKNSYADNLEYQLQGQEGHGGDIAVPMFIGLARTTCQCLSENSKSWKSYPLLINELQSMFQKAKVYSVDNTILNGYEFDAINYPDVNDPKILINRTRWLNSVLKNNQRAELILHEYLSLIGYDDGQYQISYLIIQKNKECINKQ